MNLISLDLEYNQKKEVLSAGVIEVKDNNLISFEEIFFKNKTDNKTYQIHGLNNDFLLKYGKDKKTEENLQNKLLDSPYLLGFDLKHDLKVLNINANRLYGKNKIIDIKLIIEVFNVHISLSNLIRKIGLMNQYKNILPIHTAIMDSFLTYIILEYLINYIKRHLKISTNEILYDLAEISNNKYYKNNWLYEVFLDKYYFLNQLFKEINKIELKKEESKERNIFILNDNVEIYDENFYIIGKYKKEDYNINDKTYKTISTKKDLSIGYRDTL